MDRSRRVDIDRVSGRQNRKSIRRDIGSQSWSKTEKIQEIHRIRTRNPLILAKKMFMF